MDDVTPRIAADAYWSGHMNRIRWLMCHRGTGIGANARLFMQAAVCSRFPPSLTCPLRAERPSCYSSPSWDLCPPTPAPQSNPVDRPPAHQLHLHWLAINQRHWHSRASVCGPRADVYSATQGPGPHASHRDYIIYCIRRGVESFWRKKGMVPKKKGKRSGWELGVCHAADPQFDTHRRIQGALTAPSGV